MFLHIGFVDFHCFAGFVRSFKTNIIEQALHHSMEASCADILNTGIYIR